MGLVRAFTFSALAVSAAACSGGTETGNPSFDGQLSYTGYSSEPLQIGVGADSAGAAPELATVTNAWLDLDAVSFSAATCSEAGAALQVPALGIGDHAAGKHNVTSFTASAGRFCAVELPFVNVDSNTTLPAGAPEGLIDHALVVSGTLADGAPFSITSSAPQSVHLVATNGVFELDAALPNTLIAFDFAAWLRDLDWASATRSNGAIAISDRENGALLEQFRANVPSGIELYDDRNGDGKLDAGSQLLAHGQ